MPFEGGEGAHEPGPRVGRGDDPQLAGDDGRPQVPADVRRRRVPRPVARRRATRGCCRPAAPCGVGHRIQAVPGVARPAVQARAGGPCRVRGGGRAAGARPRAASAAAPPTRAGVGAGEARRRRRGRPRASGVWSDMGRTPLSGCDPRVRRSERWCRCGYLMPVVAMPSMNLRWKARKTRRMGMTTTVAPASSRP